MPRREPLSYWEVFSAAGLGTLVATVMGFYTLFNQGLKTRDKLNGIDQKIEQIYQKMPADVNDPNLVSQNMSYKY